VTWRRPRRVFVVFAASVLALDVTWVLVEVERGWGGWGRVGEGRGGGGGGGSDGNDGSGFIWA